MVRNGTHTVRDRKLNRFVKQEMSELWKMITPSDNSLTEDFALNEFAAALQKVKPGKALGPDHICPELIFHAGHVIKSWLYAFLSFSTVYVLT